MASGAGTSPAPEGGIPLLPGPLQGQSPAQERLGGAVQGKKGLSRIAAALQSVPGQLGDVASSFGQMLNPIEEATEAVATATGRVPGTDVRLSGTERLLGAGLFALGASAGYKGYRRAQVGEPLLDLSEAGAVRLPGARFQPELGVEAASGGFRRGVVEGNPRLLEAANTDGVIDAVNRFGEGRLGRPPAADVEFGKGQLRAFIHTLGADLTSRPEGLHADTPATFVDPDEASGVAARWELAKFEAPALRGKLTGAEDLVEAWRDMLHGYPVEAGQADRLRTFMASFSEATRDFTPDMLPPPAWKLAEVARLPDDTAEVRLTPSKAAMPKQSLLAQPDIIAGKSKRKHQEIEDRTKTLDYRALVPHIAKNFVDFNDVPTGAEFRSGREWYPEMNQHIKTVASASGRPDYEVAGVMAAHSARTKWLPDNIVHTYRHFGVEAALPPGISGAGVTGTIGANARKAEEITTGDKTWAEVLDVLRGANNAGKTPAFATNGLRPELTAPTTIDAHDYDIGMGFTTGVSKPWVHENPEAYEAFAAAKRIARQVLADRGIEFDTNNAMQAGQWPAMQGIKLALSAKKRGKFAGPEDRIQDTTFVFNDSILRMIEGRDDASVAGVAQRIGPLQPDLVPGNDNGLVVAQHGDGSVGLVADPGDLDLHAAVRHAYPTVLATENGNALWRRARFGLREEVGDGFVRDLTAARPAGTAAGFDLRTDLDNVPRALDAGSAWSFHVPDGTQAAELAERLRANGWSGATALPPHTGERPRRTDRLGLEDLANMPPALLSGPESPLFTHHWVAVSANAPGSSPAAHGRLGRQLEKAGFKPIEAKGAWVEDNGTVESEESYVVFGMTPAEATRFGQDFRQVSVMTPFGEMFTTKGDERAPLDDVSKVQVRPPTGRWVITDKGEETIRAEGGGTIVPLPDGRNLAFSAGMDWDLDRADMPVQDLAAIGGGPTTQRTVVVPFDDAIPDGVDINTALADARRFASEKAIPLEPVGYFYGDPGVPGYDKAWEYSFVDPAGRRLSYRTAADGAMAPNATTVWMPKHGRPSETANTALTGGSLKALGETEFSYGGVRVQHAAKKIGTNKKGPIHYSYDGARPKVFSVSTDPTAAPSVTIGGQVPGSTLVERKGDGLLVTAPDGKLDTAVDAMEVLHRLGLPPVPGKVMVVDAQGTEVARFAGRGKVA